MPFELYQKLTTFCVCPYIVRLGFIWQCCDFSTANKWGCLRNADLFILLCKSWIIIKMGAFVRSPWINFRNYDVPFIAFLKQNSSASSSTLHQIMNPTNHIIDDPSINIIYCWNIFCFPFCWALTALNTNRRCLYNFIRNSSRTNLEWRCTIFKLFI